MSRLSFYEIKNKIHTEYDNYKAEWCRLLGGQVTEYENKKRGGVIKLCNVVQNMGDFINVMVDKIADDDLTPFEASNLKLKVMMAVVAERAMREAIVSVGDNVFDTQIERLKITAEKLTDEIMRDVPYAPTSLQIKLAKCIAKSKDLEAKINKAEEDLKSKTIDTTKAVERALLDISKKHTKQNSELRQQLMECRAALKTCRTEKQNLDDKAESKRSKIEKEQTKIINKIDLEKKRAKNAKKKKKQRKKRKKTTLVSFVTSLRKII